jgi:hypothetical protein
VRADQHDIGKPAISSQTFLQGDFQVDKTLQFRERAY